MGARVPVTTASSKSIAQVIPGRQSRVKAANFLEFFQTFNFSRVCVSHSSVKFCCFADGVTHNIARRSWWNSVLLARTKWSFSVNSTRKWASENDLEAIESQVK